MPNALRDLAHALASLTVNCGDFHEAWENAPGFAGMSGRWSGEWRSDENGHHGPIDCVLSAAGEHQVTAFFHAEYLRVLRVCYRVELQIDRRDDSFRLGGEADLGRLAGGVYQYTGELTDTQFRCTYRCAQDHGTFELKPVPNA